MLRPQEATPCPSSLPSDAFLDLRSDHTGNGFDNDTASKVDFTTDFPAPLRAAGVKRRAAAIRPKRSGTMDFAVHQDEGSDSKERDLNNPKRQLPTGEKLSALAQPAQRPRSRVNFASGDTNIASFKPTSLMGKTRQIRSVAYTEMGVQPTVEKTPGHIFYDTDETIKKPARRGTVYIPSEDTTMPTVWMGVFSPIKDVGAGDQNSVSDRTADLTGIAAQMAKKRGHPKLSVTAAPRRAPLRHSLRPPQESTISEDIPGRLTGKENLPPGHESAGNPKTRKKILGESSQQPHQAYRRPKIEATVKRPRPSSFGPETTSSRGSCSAQSAQSSGSNKVQSRPDEIVSEHDVNNNFARLRLNGGDKETCRFSRLHDTLTATPHLLSSAAPEKLPTEILLPKVDRPVVNQNYPLLSEDIQNPSLYENNWLAHQEIAITQLVNNLFDSSKGSADTGDTCPIRLKLLTIYKDQSFVILHKRLQASLLYGSLNLPKETITKSSRLPEDLGLKQKFLNLWLNTYDLHILQACAEVIIGRECSSSPRTSSTSQTDACPTQRTVSRQGLSRYFETFLIRNDDANPDKDTPNSGTTDLRRTLLRSLMLIKLLDEAQTTPYSPSTRCLFQSSSPHKSSVAVVQALAQMLNPGAGNIVRSLSHLDYCVNHVQYPLEEYDYHIDNLAIDLRDGVRLTRLVEQLLYPSSSHRRSHATDRDVTTTITMPTGEILSLMQGEQGWPLSHHLKFPCLGRATKMYNVQIALSALSEIKGVGKMVEDIKAEHIVDGFREKTVALLWGLAFKWGLASLIDWADLKHEIHRLGGTLEEEEEEDYNDNAEDLARQKMLLKEWASAAASRQGLTVHNLTTSFADGRVFEAIVDEYEPFLRATKSGAGPKANRYLSQRLADLGCSAQFCKHGEPSILAP